jgi:hypothetical protein
MNSKFLDSMDIQGTDPNLPLVIRLSVLYHKATPSIIMDHLLFRYSFRRIQQCDLLEPSRPRISSGFAEYWTREHQKLEELVLLYPGAVRRLVLWWCAERGIIQMSSS